MDSFTNIGQSAAVFNTRKLQPANSLHPAFLTMLTTCCLPLQSVSCFSLLPVTCLRLPTAFCLSLLLVSCLLPQAASTILPQPTASHHPHVARSIPPQPTPNFLLWLQAEHCHSLHPVSIFPRLQAAPCLILHPFHLQSLNLGQMMDRARCG